MHICVSKLSIIGSHNGLLPGWCQAIIWTNWFNAGILSISPLGINFNEILIEICIFSFAKMQLKMSSAKCRPFCLGLKVLTDIDILPSGICLRAISLSGNAQDISPFSEFENYKFEITTCPTDQWVNLYSHFQAIQHNRRPLPGPWMAWSGLLMPRRDPPRLFSPNDSEVSLRILGGGCWYSRTAVARKVQRLWQIQRDLKMWVKRKAFRWFSARLQYLQRYCSLALNHWSDITGLVPKRHNYSDLSHLRTAITMTWITVKSLI